MGVQWFSLAGLVWSLGWSLISTEALEWQLLPDLYDCSPGNMEVPGALGCPASWAQSEPPGVSALPWGRPSSSEAFSSSVFEKSSFGDSSSGGDSHHFHTFCWTVTTLGCVGGAGKLQKCWCPCTIWWARQSLSGCVLGQVSREETWPDSAQALPQTWQKFITTSMCLQSRICWWSVALLGNDWAVPKNSFFRNLDFKILMFMVLVLLSVSRHGKSPSKLLGCNTLKKKRKRKKKGREGERTEGQKKKEIASYCNPNQECAWWIWEEITAKKTSMAVHRQPLRNGSEWWERHGYTGPLAGGLCQHSGTARGED